ncbi:hypothetical protein ACOSP7_013697 [Xanthoceras sorbifolium]
MVPPTPTLPPIYSHDNSSKIEIKLDGSNYHLWSEFVEIFVAGKDKYGFLIGESVKPATISPTYRRCLRGQSFERENLSSENKIPSSLKKKTEPTLRIYKRQNKGKEKQGESVLIQVVQPSFSPSPVRQSDSEVENALEVTLEPSILSDDLSSENHTNPDPSLSTRRYPSREHRPPVRVYRTGLRVLQSGFPSHMKWKWYSYKQQLEQSNSDHTLFFKHKGNRITILISMNASTGGLPPNLVLCLAGTGVLK